MDEVNGRSGRRPWGSLEEEVLATLWAATEPVTAGYVQAELGGSGYGRLHPHTGGR